MKDIPKPTIEELYSKYSLEPSLRDVYVEGVFDREIFEQCCRIKKISDLYFYEIDLVEVSEEFLRESGLTVGNKQKVIALARFLANIELDCGYRCIVDRDLDHWLGGMEDVRRLIYTAHCDVESYYLSSELIKHILVVVCKCRIYDWSLFYSSFLEALRAMYALRLTDRRLGWCMSWLSFDRCLVNAASAVSFMCDDYLIRLLAQNGRTAERTIFDSKYAESIALVEGDPRACLRGHDFVELIAWIVKKYKGVTGFSLPTAIERLLVASVGEVDGIETLLSA